MEPLDSSLESVESTVQGAPVNSAPVSPPTVTSSPGNGGFRALLSSLFPRLNYRAIGLTVIAFSIIMLIGGAGLFFSAKNTSSKNQTASQAVGNFDVGNISLNGVQQGLPLQVSQAEHLVINGQLNVNSGLVLSPTSQPTAPTAGEIYYDSVQNQPYYFNGQQFVSLGQTPQVSSVQGKTGVINFTGSNGIVLNGTQITNSGVVSLSGTVNQVSVSRSTGSVVLSLAQDIAASSSPTFAGITTANLSARQGDSSLSIGVVSQGLALQGSVTTISQNGVGGSTKVVFANPSGANTITVPALTGEICTTANNCHLQASGTYVTLQATTPGQSQSGNFNISGTGIIGNLISGDISSSTSEVSGQLSAGSVSVSGGLAANNISVTNGVTAANFTGDGSNVTNVNAAKLGGQLPTYYLNAGNINTGTLSDARLNPDVVLAGANNIFTGNNSYSGSSTFTGGITSSGTNTFSGANNFSSNLNSFTGDGSNLVNLNASVITNGTLSDGRLNSDVTLAGNLFNGSNQLVQLTNTGILPNLSGINLTNLNASNIASGMLADARLSTNVTLQGNAFNGARQLVALDASGALPAISAAALINLNGSAINSGAVGVAYGGTGAGTIAGARTNLQAAQSGANSDITSLLNLTAITPTSSLTVGATNQSLTLQGSTTTLVRNNNGFTSSLGFIAPTANDVILLPDASGTICLSTGNCTGPGGPGANNSLSNLSSVALNTSLLPGSAGSVNLGSAALPFGSLSLSDGGSYSYTISGSTLTQNKNVTLPAFAGNSATICLTTGNCAGSGGGVSTGGGTANTVALFLGAQQIGNSIISQDTNATTVTIGGQLTANSQFNALGGIVTNNTSIDAGSGIISGVGSGLTSLNGTAITSGTIANARLSSNVTLQGNTFNGANELVQLTNTGILPVLSGVNLTNINASNLTSGTLSNSRLNTDVALLDQANQVFSGTNTFQPTSGNDSAYFFRIQNAAGSNTLFNADTVDSRIGINMANPGYSLDVAGQVNSSVGFSVNGVSICTTNGCTAASGNGNYIQNGTASQTANFNIQSFSPITPTGIVQGANGQTADIFEVKNSANTNLLAVAANGLVSTSSNFSVGGTSLLTGNLTANANVLFQNSANSANSFQIQNSAGAQVLAVDTTTNNLNISQGNLNINAVLSPGAPSLSTSTSGGTLAAGTYYYKLAANNANGTTIAVASTPASITTTGTTSQNTLSWTAVSNASGYTIYRSLNGTTWYSNTITSSTNSITDNGTTYTWGTSASLPTSNTTGGNANLSGNLSVNGNITTTGTGYINTNSTTALKVEQSGVNNNTLVVDTTNGKVGVGMAPQSNGANLQVSGTLNVTNTVFGSSYGINTSSNTAGNYSKSTVVGTGGVTVNDVVVLDSTGRAVDTTTARDTRVYGVSLNTQSTVGFASYIAISGNNTVAVDSGTAVNIGDQLVTSTIAGEVIVDNNATTGIIGYATQSQTAGTAGTRNTIGIYIKPTNGVTNPNIAGNLTVQGTGTSSFGGVLNVASDFNVNTNKFQVQGSTGNTTAAGTLQVNGNASIGSGAAPANGVLTVGTNTTTASGGLYFGTDTYLYRSGSATITSSGDVKAIGNLYADSTSGTTKVYIGNLSGNAGITLGGSGDTQLYRTAAGSLTVQPTSGNDNTKAFQVQNAAGTSNLLVADTTNNRIGIGTAVPGYTLDVNGTIRAANGIYTGAGANAQRIDNGGNLLHIGNLTTSGASTFSTSGANGFTFMPGTDTATAFQIQNASGNPLINFNTLNGNTRIGLSTYSTGTISQSTTTITGTGTTFTSAMNNGTIVYSDGTIATVTYVTATSLTSSVSKTVTAGSTYTILYGGLMTTSTGSVIAQNTTDSTTAFQVQNSSGASLLSIDTTNSTINVGSTTNWGGANSLNVANNVAAAGKFILSSTGDTGLVKVAIAGGAIAAGDVVIMNGSSQVVDTTIARDIRVYGVATATATAGQQPPIALLGNASVNVETSAVNIGDQLVTSTTSGKATVDNSATSGIIGIALTSKAGGSSGSVDIMVHPINGQSTPNFRPTANSTSAFQIQNAAGTSTLFQADTTNTAIGIAGASTTAGYALNVTGAVNASTNLYVNGVAVCTVNTCAAGSSTSSFINNGTTTQSGNFNVQSANTTSVAAVIQGASGGTADVLDVKNGAGTVIAAFGVAGGNNTNFSNNLYAGGFLQSDSGFQITNNSTSTGNISKQYVAGTGGVSVNDVVVLNSSSQVVDTTTSRDARVVGIAESTAAANGNVNIAISGNYQVNADTGAVNVGDQLVTSSTSGKVTVNNNATTGIIGIALSTKTAGSPGLVSIQVRPINGQSAPIFSPTTDSTTAFQIQNAAGTSNLLVADTTNNRIGINKTPTNGALDINGIAIATQYYSSSGLILTNPGNATVAKQTSVGGTGVAVNDIVVYDTSAASSDKVIDTTTARDPRVMGVALLTIGANGAGEYVATSGTYTVNADSGAINVGDQLVTSTTAGRIMADNNATTGILGIALSSKTSGSNGTVSVSIHPVGGQSTPRFQNTTDSTTAFQVQNAAGTSNLLVADTTNNRIGIGAAPANGVLTVGTNTTTASGGLYFGTDTYIYRNNPGTLYTANLNANLLYSTNFYTSTGGFVYSFLNSNYGFIAKNTIVTNNTTAGDVLISNGTNAPTSTSGQVSTIQTTTPRDPKVFGVAQSTVTAGGQDQAIISGFTVVNVDTAAVNMGDQLVTSATSGKATVDNSATTGILGIAMSTKTGGSNGQVSIYVKPVSGQSNPNFRPITDSITAFQIQNAAGASTLLQADTTNMSLGVAGASTSAGYALNVAGSINASSQIYVNGQAVCTVATGCGGGGNGYYINNSTTQQLGNFNLQAATSGSVTATLQANASGTGDVLNIKNNAGTTIDNFDNNGNLNVNLGNINISALGNPAPSISSSSTGGSLPAGSYRYVVAALDANGSTLAIPTTPSTSVTTTGSTSVNTITWSSISGATGYAIYRSTNGGSSWKVTNLSSSTISVIDDGVTYPWTTAGTLPASSTAGGNLTVTGNTNLSGTNTLGYTTINGSINTALTVTSTTGTALKVAPTSTGQGILDNTSYGTALTAQTYQGTVANLTQSSYANVNQTANAVSVTRQAPNSGYSASGDVLNINDLSGTGGSTAAGNLLSLQHNSSSVFSVNGASGAVTAHNYTNTTNAFQIQNASSAVLLNVDSTATLNLITNGGFEASLNGWSAKGSNTISQDSTNQWQGNNDLKVVTTTAAADGAFYSYSNATLTSGQPYTFSFYAKVASGSISDLSFGYQNDGVTDTDCATNQTLTTNWTRFSCTFTPGAQSGTPDVYIKKTGATAETFYIDGVQLQSGSTRTAFNPGGAIQLNGILNSPLAIQTKQDSYDALRVQSAGGNNALMVSTISQTDVQGGTDNTTVGINGASLTSGYALNVNGSINSNSSINTANVLNINGGTGAVGTAFLSGTTLNIGGVNVCTINGCNAGAGGGNYIQNGTALQVANFNIQSASNANVAAVINGASGQTADLINAIDGSATPVTVFKIGNTGAATIQTSTNSQTALQVLKSDNTSIFTVDTTNQRVGINTSTTAQTAALAVKVNGTDDAINALGVGGTSIFKVSNGGVVSVNNNLSVSTTSSSALKVAISDTTNGGTTLNVNTGNDNSNLLLAGGLETTQYITDWLVKGAGITRATDSTKSLEATNSLKIISSASSAGAGVKQVVTLNANTTYTLSVYGITTGSNISTISLGRQEDGATDSDCLTGATITTAGWTRLVCTFTTGASPTNTNIYIKQSDGVAHTYWLDAMKLEANSTATAYHDGIIQAYSTISSQFQLQNTTDSTNAFSIQNSSGSTTLLNADTLNGKIGIGGTPTSSGSTLQVTGSISSTAIITSSSTINGSSISSNNGVSFGGTTGGTQRFLGQFMYAGSNGLSTNDVVVYSNTNTVTQSTTALDSRVYGIATSSQSSGLTEQIAISGVFKAAMDMGAVNVGDQVVISSYSDATRPNGGYATVDNSATSGILGIALGTKSSGPTGLVDVLLRPNGSTTRPRFQNTTDSTTAFQIQNASGVQLLNFDTTAAGNTNLLANPGFESNITSWSGRGSATISQINTQAYEGTGSAQIVTGGSAGDGILQNYALSPSTQYTISVYVKASGSNFATLGLGRIENGPALDCLAAQTAVTTGWTRLSCSFTTGSTISGSYVYLRQSDTTIRTFYVDDFKLEASANLTPITTSGISLNGVITSPSIFQNKADSTTAFQIQNAAGTSNLLVADTTNTKLGVGMAPSSGGDTLQVNGNIYTNAAVDANNFNINLSSSGFGAIYKPYVVPNATTITAGDVVVYSQAAGAIADTTTARDKNVLGVAANTVTGNGTLTDRVAISGNTQVTADGAVNVGDQLVTSTTAGHVMADNSATTGILGMAITSVSSGGGLVSVVIRPISGQTNPVVPGNLTVQGTGTSSFAGVLNVASDFNVNTNKFQVQGSSGNVTAAGTLQVNGNTSIGSGVAPANGVLTVGTNTTTASGGLYFGTDTNLYRSAASTIKTDGSLLVASNIQGASATITGANALSLGTTGTSTGGLVFKGSTAASGTLTLQGPSTPNTGNYTLSIPAITANANICTDNSICSGYASSSSLSGYVQLAPASAQTDSSTNSSIFINKTGASGNLLQLQNSGSDVFSVSNTGNTIFKNSTNSASAFQIQDASGSTLLAEDTTTGNLTLNHGNLQVNSVLLAPATANLSSSASGGTLTANSYYYAVAATNAAGGSYYVNTNPSSITTTGTTSVNTVSWSAVTGATGYKVYRSVGNNYTWKVISVGSGTTSISDDGSVYTWTTSSNPSSLNNSGGGALNASLLQINGLTVLQTPGLWNSFVGGYVGNPNLTGINNVAQGYSDLSNLTSGNSNTALGTFAGNLISTGSYNVALGQNSLNRLVSGSSNVGVGASSLAITTGSGNTALGASAGYTFTGAGADTTGSFNTFLGYNSGFGSSLQSSNSTTLGYDSVVNQSNAIVLGCTNGVNGCTANTTVGIQSGGYAPNALTVSASNYSTGTIAQSTTAITGTGTTFTSSMSGGTIYYSDGTTATVTYVSATSLTSSVSKTVSSGSTYTIVYGGFNVTSTGTAFLQPSSDTTSVFQVNSATNGTILGVDTVNSKVYASRLVVGNDLNAKLSVQSGSVGAVINETGSNDILDLQNTGTNVLTVGSTGNTLLKNSTNSTSAFQVQNASSSPVFNVDTTNAQITVTTGSTSAILSGNNFQFNNNATSHIQQLGNGGSLDFTTKNTANTSSLARLTIGSGDNASVAFTNGQYSFKPGTDSTSAFQIQNSNGIKLLQADTTNMGLNLNYGNLNLYSLSSPGSPTLTSSATGGSIAAGTYYYLVSAANAAGISVAVPTSPPYVTTTGTSSKNTISWSAVVGATGYFLYRSSDGGNTFNRLNVGNVTSAIDNGSNYTWSGSNYSGDQFAASTGNIVLQTGSGLNLDPSGNAGLFENLFNSVALGNYHTGGGLVLQGDSLTFQDTTGYTNDFTISNTGATVYKNRSDSTTAFQIQNAAGTSNLLVADTTNSKIGIGKLPTANEMLQVSGSIAAGSYVSSSSAFILSSTNGYIDKYYTVGATNVVGLNVVVFDSTGKVVPSTTNRDSKVAGIAVNTATTGQPTQVIFGGTYDVNANATTTPINIGDQLVTSANGRVIADNNATTGILGHALSSLASGIGTVSVAVNIVSGQSTPIFRPLSDSTTAFQIQNASGAS